MNKNNSSVSRNFFVRSYNLYKRVNHDYAGIDVVADLLKIVKSFKELYPNKSFSLDDIVEYVRDFQYNTNYHVIVKAKSVWWNIICNNELFDDVLTVSYKDCPTRFAFYIEKMDLKKLK